MIDFYLMPLGGGNAVLGVQWLKMLGPMVIHYKKLSMKFFWEGKLIHLEGESDNLASAISPKQLQRLTLTNFVVICSNSRLWTIYILQNLLLQLYLLFILSYLNFKICLVNLINYLLHNPQIIAFICFLVHTSFYLAIHIPTLSKTRDWQVGARNVTIIKPSTSAFFPPVFLVKKKKMVVGIFV